LKEDIQKLSENEELIKPSHYIYGGLFFIILSLVTIFVLYRNFKNIDWGTFSIFWNLGNLIYTLIFLIVFFHLDGLRLYFVLRTLKYKIRYRDLIKLVFINIFVSESTPLSTGGGVAQVFFLSKVNVPFGIASAATLIRTVLTTSTIFFSVPIILFTEKNLDKISTFSNILHYSLFLIMGYFIFFYFVAVRIELLKFAINKLLLFFKNRSFIKDTKFNMFSEKINKELISFSYCMNNFFHGNVKFIFLTIISTIFYVISLLMTTVILLEFMGYNLSVLTVFSLQLLITFVMYFTPTPGASGVAEFGYASILANYINKNDVVALTFMWRFLTIYLGMVIGLFIFNREILKEKTKR
jgi:uncharacterized protein (TIRG00374 family)